jgi:hypothetical protein
MCTIDVVRYVNLFDRLMSVTCDMSHSYVVARLSSTISLCVNENDEEKRKGLFCYCQREEKGE